MFPLSIQNDAPVDEDFEGADATDAVDAIWDSHDADDLAGLDRVLRVSKDYYVLSPSYKTYTQ